MSFGLSSRQIKSSFLTTQDLSKGQPFELYSNQNIFSHDLGLIANLFSLLRTNCEWSSFRSFSQSSNAEIFVYPLLACTQRHWWRLTHHSRWVRNSNHWSSMKLTGGRTDNVKNCANDTITQHSTLTDHVELTMIWNRPVVIGIKSKKKCGSSSFICFECTLKNIFFIVAIPEVLYSVPVICAHVGNHQCHKSFANFDFIIVLFHKVTHKSNGQSGQASKFEKQHICIEFRTFMKMYLAIHS